VSRVCYEVLGYWPPEAGADGKAKHSGRHVAAFVLASSAMRAGELVAAKYPGIRIDQILHRAGREVIEEPAHG